MGATTPLIYCQALQPKPTSLLPGLPADTTRGLGLGLLLQQEKLNSPVLSLFPPTCLLTCIRPPCGHLAYMSQGLL